MPLSTDQLPSTSSGSPFFNRFGANALGLLVFAILLLGMGATLLLLQLSQDVRQQAKDEPYDQTCVQLCLKTVSGDTLSECQRQCPARPPSPSPSPMATPKPNGQICSKNTDCASNNCVSDPELGLGLCQSQAVPATQGISCYTQAPSCDLTFLVGQTTCPAGYFTTRPAECDTTKERQAAQLKQCQDKGYQAYDVATDKCWSEYWQ